jgi:hypothetical protein
VSIAGEVEATSIGATLNGVLSQNFATNTVVNNKFVAVLRKELLAHTHRARGAPKHQRGRGSPERRSRV